jgi:hypothetical protein
VAGLERLSKVRILVAEEIVEIPWSSRFELLERVRALHSGADLVHRFEAVGATRPVELPVVEEELGFVDRRNRPS